MRVVVVGATGNVGTAVLRALGRAPEVTSVVGIARRRPDTGIGLGDQVAQGVAEADLQLVVPLHQGLRQLAGVGRPGGALDAAAIDQHLDRKRVAKSGTRDERVSFMQFGVVIIR